MLQADGNTVNHEYTSMLRLSSSKRTDYFLFATVPDDAINLQATKDARGYTEVRVLDHHGNVHVSIDARKERASYTYSAFGNLVSITDPKRNVTTLDFDDYGRRISDNDPDHGAHTYVYNGFDEKVEEIDPGVTPGTTTTQDFYYDALGRLERLVNADGTAEWVYDGDGTRTNEIGRLIEERVLAGGVCTNANSIKYEYEPSQPANRGRLSAMVYNIRGSTFRVAHDYDSVGRVKKTTYPAALSGERSPLNTSTTPTLAT